MYIDPGAGSLALQLVAAGFLAFAAGAKSARESVKRTLRRLLGRRLDG
jgi:hypothetical protein